MDCVDGRDGMDSIESGNRGNLPVSSVNSASENTGSDGNPLESAENNVIDELEALLGEEEAQEARDRFFGSIQVSGLTQGYISRVQPPKNITKFILGMFLWVIDEFGLKDPTLAISSYKMAEYFDDSEVREKTLIIASTVRKQRSRMVKQGFLQLVSAGTSSRGSGGIASMYKITAKGLKAAKHLRDKGELLIQNRVLWIQPEPSAI